jgi:hypothetical protein
MSATVMPVYTVYYNPSDFPGQYVVRRFFIEGGNREPQADRTPLYVGDSLERARSMIPHGMYCFSADDGDDAAVIESWM